MNRDLDAQKLNRRDFAALLPLLAAVPGLLPKAAAAQGAPLNPLKSGAYQEGPASGSQRPVRISYRYLLGMLPGNIRLEAHTTTARPSRAPTL